MSFIEMKSIDAINHLLNPLRPFLSPFITGWMLATDEIVCRFKGIVWHDDGTSPAFKFKAADNWLWLPFVGAAMVIMLDFDCKFVESFRWLMETFDDKSSVIGFDVNERGTIELPAPTIRGGSGSDVTPMMLGDKFVDWKVMH